MDFFISPAYFVPPMRTTLRVKSVRTEFLVSSPVDLVGGEGIFHQELVFGRAASALAGGPNDSTISGHVRLTAAQRLLHQRSHAEVVIDIGLALGDEAVQIIQS